MQSPACASPQVTGSWPEPDETDSPPSAGLLPWRSFSGCASNCSMVLRQACAAGFTVFELKRLRFHRVITPASGGGIAAPSNRSSGSRNRGGSNAAASSAARLSISLAERRFSRTRSVTRVVPLPVPGSSPYAARSASGLLAGRLSVLKPTSLLLPYDRRLTFDKLSRFGQCSESGPLPPSCSRLSRNRRALFRREFRGPGPPAFRTQRLGRRILTIGFKLILGFLRSHPHHSNSVSHHVGWTLLALRSFRHHGPPVLSAKHIGFRGKRRKIEIQTEALPAIRWKPLPTR